MVGGRPAAADDPLIVVGGMHDDRYEARCRAHHVIGTARGAGAAVAGPAGVRLIGGRDRGRASKRPRIGRARCPPGRLRLRPRRPPPSIGGRPAAAATTEPSSSSPPTSAPGPACAAASPRRAAAPRRRSPPDDPEHDAGWFAVVAGTGPDGPARMPAPAQARVDAGGRRRRSRSGSVSA